MTKDFVPVLTTPPHVTDAPGRGIDPNISGHIAALPNLYELDAQPMEEMSSLISRQYLHGAHSTFVKWTMKKGAIVPLHHHVNEQITWITAGACEVYSQGKKYLLGAGSLMIIPPNVPHEFHFTKIRSTSIFSRRNGRTGSMARRAITRRSEGSPSPIRRRCRTN